MRLKTVVFKGNETELFVDAGKIREDIFLAEQGFSTEYDDIDKEAYHFVVYDGERPVATARMYGTEEPYHIGRVAVMKEYRGTGIGAYVMSRVEKFATEQGICTLTLSAQVRASGFYEKCGYIRYGEEYMDEFCPHIDMLKNL
jgi:predicted GNAT family N-acyltransferase